jgi:hypothetical protein
MTRKNPRTSQTEFFGKPGQISLKPTKPELFRADGTEGVPTQGLRLKNGSLFVGVNHSQLRRGYRATDLLLRISLHDCQRCIYDLLYINGEHDTTDTVHSYQPQPYLNTLRHLSGYEVILREITLYS